MQKYRKNWCVINEHIKQSKFHKYLKPVMDDLNELFSIISQSKPFVTQEECGRAKQLLQSLQQNWLEAKVNLQCRKQCLQNMHICINV